MANPRQHRKARSSAHKVVRHSRHAKGNLRKMKPIRGPKVLQDAWDKKKTLRQNYAAMGLVGSMKQSASGGTDRLVTPSNSKESSSPQIAPKEKGRGNIQRGKIVRDAEGNVIRVELPEEDLGDDDEDEMAEDDAAPKTEVVNELEKLAQGSVPVPRHSSDGEISTLKKLVTRHGGNFDAMAKDTHMNEWQRTAGQLRRATKQSIKKAGLM